MKGSNKQATLPLYIRFGELPKDENSAVHRSDQVIRNEGGVSVWRAVEDQGLYWPLLPEEPNENAIADYFHQLMNVYGCGKSKVYLVTGDEICIEGACREPLLINCKIIKEITHYYPWGSKRVAQIRDAVLKDLILDGLLTKEAVNEWIDKKKSEINIENNGEVENVTN